jgi:4-amino-4-deoxy-L-arabinose transferase-like glycosyltransferase
MRKGAPAMQRLTDFCRSRSHWLLLAAIVLLGGWLRFSRLDLMEFKTDERELHHLAVKQASGQWQLSGIVSSTGLRNPPMAVYLFAIPALISSDPVTAAMLPALLNTLAIALAYLLARRFLSRGGALAAALLFAVAPWAVIESRKIWAQDLLPFFTILFFLFAISWLREGRWRHALAMAVTLSVLNQIHYSSVALWPIILFMFWRRRSKRTLKQMLVGAALYAVLFAPFVVVVLRHQAFAPGNYVPIRASAAETPRHLAQAVWWQAQLMGHGGFETALGTSSPAFLEAVPTREWITIVFLVIIVGGLVAVLLRLRARPELWIPLLWFLLPTVFLSIHRVMFHYFIICWPVTLLLAALFGESAWQWALDHGPQAAAVARALVVVLALGLAALAWEEVNATGGFLDFVSANGGTLGDYGVCYRDKLAVADYLSREVRDGRFTLMDYSHPTGDPVGYRYLAGWLRSRRPPAAEAPHFPRPPRFVILSPAVEVPMPDPALWEYRGTTSVGQFKVQCFVPRGGER